MTETLEVRPSIGTEAWVRQNHIDVLMEQGWHFKVSGYDGEYCKVKIVGRNENLPESEEDEEEQGAFDSKVCDICGKEFSPEDYETETAAGKALGGHRSGAHVQPNNEGDDNEEQTGLDNLFPEEEEAGA